MSLARATNLAPVPYVAVGRRQVGMPGNGMGLMVGTPETHMRAMGANGTLYAIVTRCASATAAATWKLWRTAKSGMDEDRTEVTNHLALAVWNKPNPFMTRQEFVETFQQHKELTGEAWWLAQRGANGTLPPMELWPVRPDRMDVIPDPEEFIKGYEYLSPNGGRIPLSRSEVVFLRSPNPLDIYRGLGPVQAILVDLDSAKYSAEWNRNFFLNSAEPGGVIEVPEELSDEEFNQMNERWRESHQGVGNAHRVSIIEKGKWVGNVVTQRDMQFAELRGVSREVIREAFAFPKPLLGAVDDVNRANADAAEVVFARWLIKDRLERIKQALNAEFLPMYGALGAGLEFDYENPVPEDREANNAELAAKSAAVKIYVDLGFVPKSVLEVLELPDMEYEKPPPPPAPTFGGAPALPPGATPKVPAAVPAELNLWSAWSTDADGHVHNAANPDDVPNLERVQIAWEHALAALVAAWGTVRAAQMAELAAQITDAIDNGNVAGLAHLRVTSADGVALLADAMTAIGAGAGAHVVAEARAQGVDVQAAHPNSQTIADAAALTVTLIAASFALAAGREALRIHRAEPGGRAVADAVLRYLVALGDGALRAELGAALTHAQNQGRFETLLSAPVAALYASEQNDKNTCAPCHEIDGRWLGNTDSVGMEMLNKTYPNSGYVGCLGRDRCRGTVVGVWRKGTE